MNNAYVETYHGGGLWWLEHDAVSGGERGYIYIYTYIYIWILTTGAASGGLSAVAGGGRGGGLLDGDQQRVIIRRAKNTIRDLIHI